MTFVEVTNKRFIEKALAVASFIVAAALAFTSMSLNPEHEITANVLLAIAQFLTFAATILGIDYKFNKDGWSIKGNSQQQPVKHS